MTYAFPLPPCSEHTFQWEDGEHSTCYRCGAPAETPTTTSAQEAAMKTFTPGTKIRDWQTGRTGTVVEDAKTSEYHGFIPIHWDNGDRTLAHPSVLAATGAQA